MLKGMNQQWRRNIKKAAKAGRRGRATATSSTELKAFHDLYVHTAERDHFTPRPLRYFETMFEALGAEEPDRIRLYLARHEGDLVAATIWIRVGAHTLVLLRRLLDREARRPRLQRRAVADDPRRARGRRARLRPARHHRHPRRRRPHVGLIQFKVGTGGEAVEYAGEWDLPAQPGALQGVRPLHDAAGLSLGLTLHVDGDRWRAPPRGRSARPPRPRPGRQGQRLRLRPAPARPQGPVARRRHPRRRHLRRAARGRPALRRVAAGAHPWRPFDTRPTYDARVIHTVGRLEDLEALAEQGRGDGRPAAGGARADDLDAAPRLHRHASCARPPGWRRRAAASASRASRCTCRWPRRSHLSEVERLMNDVVAAELASSARRRTVWVSHLTDAELAPLALDVRRLHLPPAHRHRAVARRPWRARGHGHGARRPRGRAGRRVGYRGRTAPRAGTLLVVSGGTAHGIGLEAPTGEATLQGPRPRRSRAAASTPPGSCGRRTPWAASSGCSPSRRTCRPRCCSSRPAPRCPRWATRSTCRVRFTATGFDRVEIS